MRGMAADVPIAARLRAASVASVLVLLWGGAAHPGARLMEEGRLQAESGRTDVLPLGAVGCGCEGAGRMGDADFLAELRGKFAQADRDDSGLVSVEELSWEGLSAEEAELVVRVADCDRDGLLSFDESVRLGSWEGYDDHEGHEDQ